jgi:hypothetical protein
MISKDISAPNLFTFELNKKGLHGSIAFFITTELDNPKIIQGIRGMRRMKFCPAFPSHEEVIAIHSDRQNTFSNPRRFHRRILRRAEGVSIKRILQP